MFKFNNIIRLMMIFTGLSTVVLIGSEVFAQNKSPGLPLPRFASLRADKTNMRTGSGVRYPIDWVYQRPGLPVEIIAEYGNWRKVRDWLGAQGWAHQSMPSGKRYFS